MDNELEQQLDAFARGESDPPAFIEKLCADCSATPDLAWDVLAITDQYHRRGRISAELSRTIRVAIERPAVARQVPELADALALAQQPHCAPLMTAPGPAPIARRLRPAAPVPPAQLELQEAMQALRSELDASRRTVLRYRARLAKLGAFARNQRSAVASLRRQLEVSPIASPAPASVGLYAALDLAPYEPAPAGVVVEAPRAHKPWISASQAAATIALLLTVTSSPALREPPAPAAVMPAAAVAAAADSASPAVPAAPARQYLNLGRELYVVAPAERRAVLRVQRTGGSTGAVSFRWWTRPSGAKPGIDYRGRLPTVAVLPEGVDAMTISIPIFTNPFRAHTELFYVEIGRPSGGAAIGAIGRSAVILIPSR